MLLAATAVAAWGGSASMPRSSSFVRAYTLVHRLDLDRTQPLRQELAWLPPELRAVRWSMWGLSAALAGLGLAVTVASGGLLAYLAALGAAGGALATGRLGRSLLQRRVEQLAHGQLDLVRLGAEREGRLIHVVGRVATAGAGLAGLLHGVPGVCRRMTFRLGGQRYLHEAAVDFDLVDAGGERISVLVDGARLCVPPPGELVDYPPEFLDGQVLPTSLEALLRPQLTRLRARGRGLPAAESVLRVGAAVEIVGCKTERVDPTVGSAIGRKPPMRPALRSGRIPLIICPAVPPE
jgi:hypothetical protein